MPVVGTRKSAELDKINRGYASDSMHALAEQFTDIVTGALNESGLDIYSEPSKFFMHDSTKDSLRRMFIENSYDPEDPKFKNNPEAVMEHEEMMGALFENDCEAIMENAPLGSFNPTIGISHPMHKNLLANCAFDKFLPTDVTQSPKFTLTMETRTLVDTEGNEIDIFLEQNKIHDAVANSVPNKYIVLPVPENESTDIIGLHFNGSGDLSIRTHITGVVVNAFVDAGEKYMDATGAEQTASAAGAVDRVVPINEIEFRPAYGEFDLSVVDKFKAVYDVAAKGDKAGTVAGTISGYMKKNRFMLMCSNGDVKGLQIHAVLDVSSAAFKTCHTKWSARTDIFQVPEAPHITTNVSPEEVKDVNALYQVNQVTKIMSIMNLALGNYKDDDIHLQLDKSFVGLPESQQFSGAFDFVPPTNYLQDPVSWRQAMFMDQLDTYVTSMLRVLNDENMTIAVIGRPDLIRKVTPTQYIYQSPSSIGPVELEFTKTVVTSDKRVYEFISTAKMSDNNNLIVVLKPRNSNRVMYKVFNYQFYVSNEIRDAVNYPLPAVTAFERWKMIQYQPVQCRIQIVNPRGLREVLDATDPIGTSAMNDYTANGNTHASAVNGAVATAGKHW